jgi:peptidoglycan-associated lipoprotein
MMSRKDIISGFTLLLIMTVLFFAGACSQKSSRVDTSAGTGLSTTQKAAAEEEEARRKAEAERQAAQSRAAGAAATQGTQKVMTEVEAFESEPIYFDFDRSEIKAEYRPVLEKKAAFLKARPEYTVRIEGHCDERGTAEYNVALGEKRALSVKDYLVALGVPAKRISTISYGEERPAVRGQDEAAWAKNRRAEFRLLK